MAKTTIVETFRTGDDEPERGFVTFALATAAQHDDDAIVTRSPVKVLLDSEGAMSVDLQPTSGADADWSVENLSYRVQEVMLDSRGNPRPKRTYYIDVPTSGADVRLGDLATYATAPSMYVPVPGPQGEQGDPGPQGPAGEVTEAEMTAALAAYVTVNEAPLDPARYGAVGDGVTDDSAAINAALAAAKAAGTPSMVLLRGRRYGVGSTLKVATRVELCGLTPGGDAGQGGSTLVALASLAGPVVETENITDGVGEWWHKGALRDLRIDCSAQASGPGVKLYRLGETATVDRVLVVSAAGHGFHFYGESTPFDLGHLTAHACGRGGAGSGVFLADTGHTASQIGYIAGDNNATALVEVQGLGRSVLRIGAIKSERWGASPGNPIVVKVVNGNGGTVQIGVLRVHKSAAVSNGTSIIHNEAAAGSTVGRVVVSGAIEYQTDANYANDYYESTAGGVTATIAWNTLRGRSLVMGGQAGLDVTPAPGAAAALRLRRLDAGSGTPYIVAGAANGEANDRFRVGVSGQMEWGPGSAAIDTNLYRGAANILATDDALRLLEQGSDPSAPSANYGVLYLRDNGSGKTQLCVRFNTGAVQVIATEP